MKAANEPTYEELLEENFELNEEKKIVLGQVQALENSLVEERSARGESELRASEIDELQSALATAQEDAKNFKLIIHSLKQERTEWEREHKQLETALHSKEDRYC